MERESFLGEIRSIELRKLREGEGERLKGLLQGIFYELSFSCEARESSLLLIMQIIISWLPRLRLRMTQV